MKEVKGYKCDYCRTTKATVKSMEKHERQCVHNPNSVNCFRCVYAFAGGIYSFDGFPTGRQGACCAYTEDNIEENIAHKCGQYKLSPEMYYTKQECPETEESEA